MYKVDVFEVFIEFVNTTLSLLARLRLALCQQTCTCFQIGTENLVRGSSKVTQGCGYCMAYGPSRFSIIAVAPYEGIYDSIEYLMELKNKYHCAAIEQNKKYEHLEVLHKKCPVIIAVSKRN